MASVIATLHPAQMANLIKALHAMKLTMGVDGSVDKDQDILRRQATIYTFNLMIAGLFHYLATHPDYDIRK